MIKCSSKAKLTIGMNGMRWKTPHGLRRGSSRSKIGSQSTNRPTGVPRCLSSCLLIEFLNELIERETAMTKPIPDKAEVALEYPDKLYIGTFERSSRFE